MIKRIVVGTFMASSAFAQSDMAAVVEKLKTEVQNQITVMSYRTSQDSTVKGAPYSADETTTTTQMLFDGNRIVNSSAMKVYRDQQGRTRVERTLANIGNVAAGQPTTNVTINDPVAGIRYVLDAGTRSAFKSSLSGGPVDAEAMARLKKLADEKQVATTITRARTDPGSFTFTTSSGGGTIALKSNGKREELGSSNMSGVAVQGSKTTTVIPAGTMGNDRDINIVEEHWYSPDLKMNVMTKRTDPRMGETVFQVNNLSRLNPDMSLFQVPGDYQVKDSAARIETTGFKIVTKE
jgi:hypothetical protein